MSRSSTAEHSTVISGLGASIAGREPGHDPLEMTIAACVAAVADAGLDLSAIDGISTYPGASGSTPGISGAGVNDVATALSLDLRWCTGGSELSGQLGSVINGVLAIHAGLVDHVLCFRSVWEYTAQTRAGTRSAIVSKSKHSVMQWSHPFGAGYATWGGLAMQRYMHETGATREQFAQLAVVSRDNAAWNPLAVYRDPLTVDDYLNARMISDPLCIYDCDVPVDGAVAFVLSRADAPSLNQKRCVSIEAMSATAGFEACAETLWARTDLKPSDVDVAQLYDGFTVYLVRWLEALGLTPRGETGAFIEGGTRISLDGELPLSTGGGQLSGGRLHGYGAMLEACLQLRGEGGDRQVPDDPEVAVVSSGAESFTSSLLLAR